MATNAAEYTVVRTYLDWMLSPSANSAAAMLMREAMLMRQYGQDYPPPEAEIQRFFEETLKKELTALFKTTFYEPLTRNGFDLEQFRQGSFFTRNGKKFVNGGGNSYATARTLMEYVLRMEQGQLVDEWSSRQIKRLLYMTERRIRYASAPALRDAAVYFKSGSPDVARFLGPVNTIPERLFSLFRVNGYASDQTPSGQILARPENLTMTSAADGPGRITDKTFAGHYTAYRVELQDTAYTVYSQDDRFQPGQRVALTLKPY